MTKVRKIKSPLRYAFAIVPMMSAPSVMAQPVEIDPVTNCTINEAFIDGYFAGLDELHKLEGFRYPDNKGFMEHKGTANFNCGAKSAWKCMEPLMAELDVTPNVPRAVVGTSLTTRADHCVYIEKGPQFLKALGL